MAISEWSAHDTAPDINPESAFWRGAPAVAFDSDTYGRAVADRSSKVLCRWTRDNLYFLFICPYKELHLKPRPETAKKTDGLWNWDVAEVFIGSDFKDIRQYREFEISPQGEWLDLAIDLNYPEHKGDLAWKSGLQAAARIDRARKVWYGFLRIPYRAVDARPAKAGNRLRINFFRSQGPEHQLMAWRPTGEMNFHVPQAFGVLRLAKY